MKEVISTCIYCGCGCRLKYLVEKGEIKKVIGLKSDAFSEGKPCIKGLTINQAYNKNRIKTPLIYKKKASLARALELIYERTKGLSPNELMLNTSGKLTNEDNYVIQDFAKKVYNTSNIDCCCGRICHSATLLAMNNCLGVDNVTRIKYLDEIDCLLIIGSNPEASYPVFYNKLMSKKVKVIHVNSFLKADVTVRPGSETALLNGLINSLIKKGVKSRIQGFDLLKKKVSKYDEKIVCKLCGISKEEFRKVARAVSNSKRLGVFHGMGLTQQVNGIENVHSLLNLVMLKKGRVLTLRGEINVQGAGNMTSSLSSECGYTKGMNLIEAIALSPVKAALIFEFNPAKSMPDLKTVRSNLKEMFLVYFGSHWNETARMADVVIPIASLLESEGTITNGEKRIRKVNRVIEGPSQAWEVLKRLAALFNKEMIYECSKDITIMIKQKVNGYNHISVGGLWAGKDSWADKIVKHKRFVPEEFEGYDEYADKNYPLILTTYRSKYCFLSNEVTKGSATLKKAAEKPGFYLNPVDAKKLRVKQGDLITVKSRVGSLKAKAIISKKIPKGVVGAYIHYFPVNKIVPLRFDEESFTPNYKGIAVNVKKKA